MLCMHADPSDRTTSVKLLRPRACADALGVSLTTLWRWTKRGDFPVAYRLSANATAFDEREVSAWLEGRRVTDRTKTAAHDASAR